MEQVHSDEKLKRKDFRRPSSISTGYVCTRCGGKAIPDNCRRATGGTCLQTEYYASGTEPEETCNCHQRQINRQKKEEDNPGVETEITPEDVTNPENVTVPEDAITP